MLLLSSTRHLYGRNYPIYACNRAERSKPSFQLIVHCTDDHTDLRWAQTSIVAQLE